MIREQYAKVSYMHSAYSYCGNYMRRELYTTTFTSLTPVQMKEGDAELDLGLAELLQQRRRRAQRRFQVRPWILRRGGISLGTSDASPSFLETCLSSDMAKIKIAAILNEVLPVISALKLNAGQRWGSSYSWLARTCTELADNSCIVV